MNHNLRTDDLNINQIYLSNLQIQTFILFIYGENETEYKVCKYRDVQAVRRRK